MKSRLSLSLLSLLRPKVSSAEADPLRLASLYVWTCLWTCLFIGSSSVVYAQVNVEQNRLAAKEGFTGNADAALTLIRGNVSLTQTSVGAKLNYTRGIHTPFAQVALDYGEKESVPFLSQSYGHVRWTAMWSRAIGTETFAQLQANTFRSLILRQLYGGGVRSELWSSSEHSLAIGAGAMYEREVYREPAGPDGSMAVSLAELQESDVIENNLRLTNYLSTKHTVKWDTEINILGTIYYQPRADQLSDYRILFDLSIEIKLSDHLRLVESLGVMYDSAPPDDVQRGDLKSLSALRVSF